MIPSAAKTSSTPQTPREEIYPQCFTGAGRSPAAAIYLQDSSIQKLADFFEKKSLQTIKDEDQRQQWYEDWIAYQAEHRLYASLLSPQQYSRLGYHFDLFKLTRCLEVFAYFSPAHGYSLQCTFLGLFAILMGSNADLKRQAVAALEAGALFAFGVSEKNHGADLLSNEFTVRPTAPGQSIANGSKYYIGNANAAAFTSILACQEADHSSRSRRAVPILFALRPAQSPSFSNLRKIPTLGIRAAFVGEFTVRDHPLPDHDIIARGRDAWDAVLGTVTLGKFFLGFGSIGICQHAFQEAKTHLTQRILYGKPVIAMPHIRQTISLAYARITAMKLFAYRALDYLHAATAADRRYLLFNAVQKARVSTEGVKVMALLSECVGAKGFESDTYFEMALRDVQLIPGLEGSMHINLALAAQFLPQYFAPTATNLPTPPSLIAAGCAPPENSYLMEARTTAVNTIAFPPFSAAYHPLASIPNVRFFATQARAFSQLIHRRPPKPTDSAVSFGHCLAIIVYAQLICENATRLNLPREMSAVIFHALIADLSASAQALLSSLPAKEISRTLINRLTPIPQTPAADWDFVAERACGETAARE